MGERMDHLSEVEHAFLGFRFRHGRGRRREELATGLRFCCIMSVQEDEMRHNHLLNNLRVRQELFDGFWDAEAVRLAFPMDGPELLVIAGEL